MLNEIAKTFEAVNDFIRTLFDPTTYLGDLSPKEFEEFYNDIVNCFFKVSFLNAETYLKAITEMQRGDTESILNLYLNYISNLEDIFADLMDNPVIAAYLSQLNKLYLRSLHFIQNLNNAFFHSIGLATRKDIVALSEAYVDLKGDIKRETRRILREIKKLQEGSK
uniref:Poly(3-hydroxyalkanoate) polymerase subunit PhaE n=1 Tax=Geoglobus ahangari TaxID=113653 RepID=A0A7C3UI72_9EURY